MGSDSTARPSTSSVASDFITATREIGRKITVKDRPCFLHPPIRHQSGRDSEIQNPGPVSKQVAKDTVPGLSPARAHAVRNVEASRACSSPDRVLSRLLIHAR